MRVISEAAISLGKLKRLFDFATKGIKDDELLDDVYEDWFYFIKRGVDAVAVQVEEDKEENEKEFGVGTEPSDDILRVQQDLIKALEILDKNEFQKFDKKNISS